MRTLLIICLSTLILYSFTYTTVSFNGKSEETNTKVNFRIQLCEYRTIIPVNKVELLRQIGAQPIKSSYGSIYVTQPYANEQEAEKDLPKFRALGFDDAQSVVEMGTELLSVENYHDLYKNDASTPPEKAEHGVVRIWK